jgi:streptogramin lyase
MVESLEDRQLLAAGMVTELPTPLTGGGGASYVAEGSDGNYWYTELAGGLGRITPSGVVTQFRTHNFTGGIALGPDSNIWFTEPSNGFNVTNWVGRITPAGVLTEFPIPTLGCNARFITSGPDGNLWFTEEDGDKAGRVTTAGVITEYAFAAHTTPEGIAAGPDGNLWFGEFGQDAIGRFSPVNPTAVTNFPLGAANSPSDAMCAGPDGSVWFGLVGSNRIGKISTSGTVALYTIPSTSADPRGIGPGPDGDVWFAENGANKIGIISRTGIIVEIALGSAKNGLPDAPRGVAIGADGTVVFTEEEGDRLGAIITQKTDAFIQRLYATDLGRSATLAELNAWESALESLGTDAVVQGIGRSNEAYAFIVNSLYSRYLGRKADTGGLIGFVSYLRSGGTEEGVASAILGSTEYYNRVSAGSADPTCAFVQSLYHDLLNRTPAASEVAAWNSAIASLGRTSVASAFVGSAEYRSDVVASDYQNLLYRAAPPAENAGWVNSGLDLYSIELLFETTGEFLQKSHFLGEGGGPRDGRAPRA